MFIEGVCCEYCEKLNAVKCPVKATYCSWSRWEDWCSKYEPNKDIPNSRTFPFEWKWVKGMDGKAFLVPEAGVPVEKTPKKCSVCGTENPNPYYSYSDLQRVLNGEVTDIPRFCKACVSPKPAPEPDDKTEKTMYGKSGDGPIKPISTVTKKPKADHPYGSDAVRKAFGMPEVNLQPVTKRSTMENKPPEKIGKLIHNLISTASRGDLVSYAKSLGITEKEFEEILNWFKKHGIIF